LIWRKDKPQEKFDVDHRVQSAERAELVWKEAMAIRDKYRDTTDKKHEKFCPSYINGRMA